MRGPLPYLMAVLSFLLVPTRALAWRHTDTTPGSGFAVAVAPNGDVALGTQVGLAGTLRKLAGDTGALLWAYPVPGPIWEVVVDANGDFYGAGPLNNKLAAFKIHNGSGTIQWSSFAAAGIAHAIVLDHSGAPIVGGETLSTIVHKETDFTVRKLHPLDGGMIWERRVLGLLDDNGSRETVWDMAVDAFNEVVAVGMLAREDDRVYAFAVVKLLGASGVESWRALLSGGPGTAYSVGVDPAGDVIACGFHGTPDKSDAFTVVKFDGTDGA